MQRSRSRSQGFPKRIRPSGRGLCTSPKVLLRYCAEACAMRIQTNLVSGLMVAVLGISSSVWAADPLTLKTAQGKAHGKTINDGKVRAFMGLPYAAPPVGDLRWKAPQPAAKWTGVRDASKYGAHFAQNAAFADMICQDGVNSED